MTTTRHAARVDDQAAHTWHEVSTHSNNPRRRIAKPPTTPSAIAAARKRRDELVAVLATRGRPVNREQLRREATAPGIDPDVASAARVALRRLERGPYAVAAAAYLQTHDKFAWQEARKVEARHVEVEDLVQAARIGMLKGLDRFDATLVTSGVVTSFLSYARWWVRCEIGRALDDEALVKIPSTARKTATDLRKQIADISSSPEQLSDEDVADALRLPLDKVKQYRHLHLGHEHFEVATSDCHENSQSSQVTERIVEASTQHAQDGLQKARGGALEQAVGSLPALQRRLVCEEFGMEMDDAAARAARPCSVAAVKALLKAAMSRLRHLLGDEASTGMLFCF